MSAHKILNFVNTMLAPPAPVESVDYHGVEYRYKNIVFRPGSLIQEGIILVIIIALLSFYLIGSKWNKQKVQKWWSLFDPRFAVQFRALSPLPDQPLISDGPTTYLYYLTGRRNMLYLHVIFELIPRHSLAEWIAQTIYGVFVDPSAGAPEDTVTLEFCLGEGQVESKSGKGAQGQQGEGPGVFAVVDKSGGVLKTIRKERWDTTFAKAQENPLVPQTHLVLSESVDSSDYILKTPNVGLAECLAEPKCARWLKSLIISDQPTTRPSKGPLPDSAKSRRLTLVLRVPSSQSEMEETLPLVQVAFNLIDLMAKVPVKPETTRKLRKVRNEINEQLTKSYVQQLKEEAEENGEKSPEDLKREAKRKAEAARRALLSPEEQRKLEEKDRKKEMKKSQKGRRK